MEHVPFEGFGCVTRTTHFVLRFGLVLYSISCVATWLSPNLSRCHFAKFAVTTLQPVVAFQTITCLQKFGLYRDLRTGDLLDQKAGITLGSLHGAGLQSINSWLLVAQLTCYDHSSTALTTPASIPQDFLSLNYPTGPCRWPELSQAHQKYFRCISVDGLRKHSGYLRVNQSNMTGRVSSYQLYVEKLYF